MTFDEIINIEGDIRVVINKLKSSGLIWKLTEVTSFLDEGSRHMERIYCYRNNIKERKICNNKNCNNYVKFRSIIFYSKYCSYKCSSISEETIALRERTCMEKYNTTHHMKSKSFMNKYKENSIRLFGVDNISKLESVKDKKKETFNRNYGIDHIFSSNELKGEFFMKKHGYDPYIPKYLKSEFEIYKDEVWKLTLRIKKVLISEWNGYDYYDNESIIENYKLHYNDNSYPSIDHKISIYDGFIKKIDPSIIGDRNNLCITKRSINKRKGVLSELDFKV